MIRKWGFTIVEMLVVIAILGVILSGITQMVATSMQATSLAQAQAEQIISLKDATGYVSDQIRSATAIYSSVTFGTGVGASTCTDAVYDPSTNPTPCFGVLQPIVLDSAGSISTTDYQIRIYRFRSRSGLSSNLKTPNSWADSNTFVLEEYPITCATASCSNGTSVTVATTGVWYLIADQLTVTGPSNTLIRPFATTPSTGTRTGAELRMRSVALRLGRQIFIPSQDVYFTRVLSRNR